MTFKLPIEAPELDELTGEEEEPKEREIPDGPELLRICRLPTRPVLDLGSTEAEALADHMTRALAKTDNPYPGRLRPIQALALKEAWKNKGLFGAIGVGYGKTLFSYLIPVVTRAERPLYMCPKKLEADVLVEFEKFRGSWHGPTARGYPVVSYELLSNPSSAEELDPSGNVIKPGRLDVLRPDLIVLDECHCVATSSSAVTMRLRHYLKANPGTIVVAISGTPFKSSIRDVAHILEWTHRDRSPIPRGQYFNELQAWAGFLDARASFNGRVELGALTQLATATGVPAPYHGDVNAWRRVVAQRLYATEGVVSTTEQPIDIPLYIDHRLPKRDCPDITAAIEELVTTETLPDGTELSDGLSVARHVSTMALGFFSVWSPAPPQSWRAARNAWAKWCRKALKSNKRKIVSEGTMKRALRRGLFKNTPGLSLLQAWEAEEAAERQRTGLREPPSVPVWISDEAINEAGEWVAMHGGLVWVAHIGLGERLAETLGIPYYGAHGGLNEKTGIRIQNHPGGPAVASVWACGTGKNLQGFWSKNLWLTTPGEQSLARTHRPGQKAASVQNWLYIGGMAHLNAFNTAVGVKAQFAADMTLSPQKLQKALTTMPRPWDLECRGGARWARKLESDDTLVEDE